MKAAVGATLFFLTTAAGIGRADPTITAKNFKCEYRPRIDGSWEKKGFVDPQTQGENLVLLFRPYLESFDSYEVATTGNVSEHRVEMRCSGSVTLRSGNGKPFKIKDFKFEVDGIGIGSPQGKVELKLVGMSAVTGTSQKDSFEKVWTIRQPDLSRVDVFASKQESNTVCGQELTLRFDEMRATVMREESSFDVTEIFLQSLNINFVPCS
jgi:hypothetical protein